MLKPVALRGYVAEFNRYDRTHFGQSITSESAADWMLDNLPLFECSDLGVEETCHFRGWTFLKHIKQTLQWERAKVNPDGLFWQVDDRNGMEVSISGQGKRPTITSYMDGDVRASARQLGLGTPLHS